MTDKHLLDMPPDRMEGEVVVAFFFDDDRPLKGAAALIDWRLNGHLTRQLLDGAVTGASRDALLIMNNGKLESDWALLVGGGQRKRLSSAAWTRLVTHIFKICDQAGFKRISICLDADETLSMNELTALVREVYAAGNYGAIDYYLSLGSIKSASTQSDYKDK